MSASSWTETAWDTTPRLTSYRSWAPEWPVLLLTAGAWAWLAFVSLSSAFETSASGMTMHDHGSMIDSSAPMSMSPSLGDWAVMCVGMMLPLAVPAARHVALNSLRRRRLTGMTAFTVGYLLPWVGFGALVLWLDGVAAGLGVSQGALTAVLLLVAAVWQVSPTKRQAVLSCNRTVPLAPFGLREITTRLEFGVRQAGRCMVACWPLMAAMSLLPHGPWGLVLMAVLTVWMVVEAGSPQRRRLVPWLAVPLVGAAAALGMAAAL